MSKVFFSVTMSMDGFTAPEWRSDEQWFGQWGQLQSYVLQQKFFRENLKLGDGGETGIDNQILEATYARTGVTILGKRMFDLGERLWPEEAPFHTPVFVLTHQVRAPWERKGGTVFHFVNDGIENALARAREEAGGRDIRIGGGAHVIQQYLQRGLIDEFDVAIAPVLIGQGSRLFDRLDPEKLAFEIVHAKHSPRVTHVRYAVSKRA